MPEKIEKPGDRRSFIMMVRFMQKHKAVIVEAAEASGCKSASAWVRSLVWKAVRDRLDENGDPLGSLLPEET